MQIRDCMTDAARFTELYRRHSPKIFRFALHMSGSETVAEEATQETFLMLIRQPAMFDPERGSIEAFLFGVARNQVYKQLERDRRFQGVEEADEEQHVAEGDVLGDLARQENLQALMDAILCLPPKYREAVVLCDLEELSYEAAANAIGCAIGTVRSRLHRARNLLIGKLQARCMV